MRKTHIVVLLVLAAGIYYFGFRPSALDKLLTPLPAAATDVVRDTFVAPDYSHRPIDDRDFAAPGQYTIVYYHWASCPGCRKLDSDINELLRLRNDVLVRRISLVENWSTQGAMIDFGRNMGHTPFIIIYGPDRKVIAQDDGTNSKAFNLLYDWINVEARRDWEKKKVS